HGVLRAPAVSGVAPGGAAVREAFPTSPRRPARTARPLGGGTGQRQVPRPRPGHSGVGEAGRPGGGGAQTGSEKSRFARNATAHRETAGKPDDLTASGTAASTADGGGAGEHGD